MKNPNAVAAGSSSGVAALIVYVARLFGLGDLPPEVAILFAGLLTVTVIAIGRDGIAGIFSVLMHGRKVPPL